MQIHIFSPNIQALFSEDQITTLKKAGTVFLHSTIASSHSSQLSALKEIKELFEGDDKRILALDPDCFDWSFPMEIIEKIPHLEAIVLQTTSFSWLDTALAAKHGIPVVNLRGFSATAVAEWATMLTLMIARKFPLILEDKLDKDYVKHKGIELRGKTAGIIGLGAIGTKLAENMQGLGMKVQYWSKSTRDDRFEYKELDELMKTADVILPAVAYNNDTAGLITDEMLKSLKKTAIFVSIVHSIFNEELLLEIAQKGDIYGYATESEHPKLGEYKGNVWVGPSLAWCTEDSLRKNAEQWIEGMLLAAKGEFPNKIN